jgi:hypothetical protein
VVDVRPANETRAAGVPLFVDAAVKNFGPETARNVQLKVRTQFYDPDLQQSVPAEQFQGQLDELPTVLIDEIQPGQVATRRLQVFYAKAGRHVVQAALPDDAVVADNRRWCVIDFPDSEPVLIIDGSTEQRHAYFLQSVFQPGGRARTGIDVEIKTAAFLRDVTPEVLEAFRAVYLLDVPQLDDRAVENLDAYVRTGGGVGIFVGPHVDLSFYNNRLYQGGEGLFPLPLAREDFLPPQVMENVPDIQVTDHPVFSVFLGERNPFIRLITVESYLRPAEDWKPDPESTVVVAASLRNKMPLAVEKKVGEGRVMVFLTTLSPDWNNWGNDPSFVVVALKLQSHLSSALRINESRPAGSSIVLQLEVDKYRQDMQFITPGQTPDARVVIERVADDKDPQRGAAEGEPQNLFMWAGIGHAAGGDPEETERSGVYEAWPVTVEGRADVRRYALNVETPEGDLATVSSQTLLEQLRPVKADYRFADEFSYEEAGLSGNNRSLFLMCLLIGLLLAEQLMAYSASYHPPRGSVA